MKIIKNGKILDQQGNLVQKDIQIENGLITKISENIENPNAEIIDAEGKLSMCMSISVNLAASTKRPSLQAPWQPQKADIPLSARCQTPIPFPIEPSVSMIY